MEKTKAKVKQRYKQETQGSRRQTGRKRNRACQKGPLFYSGFVFGHSPKLYLLIRLSLRGSSCPINLKKM